MEQVRPGFAEDFGVDSEPGDLGVSDIARKGRGAGQAGDAERQQRQNALFTPATDFMAIGVFKADAKVGEGLGPVAKKIEFRKAGDVGAVILKRKVTAAEERVGSGVGTPADIEMLVIDRVG